MKRFVPYLTAFAFFGILTLFLVLGLICPDHPYSKTEKRTLTQRPVLDLTDLQALTERFSDYTVDQFPFRERMLRAYSALELAQDKRFARDTYVTQDGWLMTYIYPVTKWARQSFVEAIGDAAASLEASFLCAVLPQKNDMLAELAKPYVDNRISDENKAALLDALAQLHDLTTIDVGAHFLDTYSLQERTQLYYRTDFHWNTYGAFLAAQYISEEMAAAGLLGDVTLPTASDFLWEELGTEHFYQGDINRRFSNLFSMREAIPHYTLPDASALRYYCSVDDTKPAQREQLVSYNLTEEILNYNGLSTDNLGYYRVVNPAARSERRILILKDSFQNPTIDYFTELFAQVIVVDPRYYAEPYTFSELLERNGVELVLLMYHQNNASRELVEFLQ